MAVFKTINLPKYISLPLLCLTLSLLIVNNCPAKTLVVVGDKSYAPFEFLDDKNKPRGIFIDYWRLWSKKTGIKVDHRLLDWPDAQKAVLTGEADVISGFFYSEEREKKYDFSAIYYEMKTHIFFHNSIYGLQGLEDLSGFRIGVIAGGYTAGYITEKRPDLEMVVYPDHEQLARAAVNGEIRVFTATTPVMMFYLAKLGKKHDFRKTEKPIYSANIHAAVKKGDIKTLALVNGGIKAITPEEVLDIQDSWIGDSLISRVPWRIIAIITFAALSAFLVIITWNRQLSRKVAKATEEIKAQREAVILSEMQARRSEELFRRFTELSQDCIMRFDRHHKHLYVNDVAEAMTGIPPSEFIGKTHDELNFPKHLIGLWYEAIETVFTSGEHNRIEFELPNSIWIDWLLFPEKDLDGNVTAVMTSARDITQYKKSEAEKNRIGRFLETVIDNASMWICVVDNEFNVVLWNIAAEIISGYAREEALGGTLIWERIYPEKEYRRSMLIWFKEIFASDKGLGEIECRITARDGSIKLVSWTVRTLLDENSRRIGGLAIGQDITDKALLEERLLQSQKMQAIGTLASGIAHDFNNILQAISGFVQLMSAVEDRDENDREHLGRIEQSTRRAAGLVEQLLTFGRRMEPKVKTVDMNKEIKNISDILSRTLPRMISIETRLSPDLKMISADPNQIEQMLLNLGSNAGDAMPDGGRLVIETWNFTADEEYCGLHGGFTPGEYVQVFVSDTGQGMDQETRQHIFEPFFTTKEIGKGTGLGLFTVYGIVNNNNGRITCYSEPGLGTVFKIYFPALVEASQGRSAPDSERSKPKGGEETILLVDDEPAIIEVAGEMLSQHGYEIMIAISGEEALEIYKEDGIQIDLVVLDLGMPGMGGQAALRKIIEINPMAKVIIASGYSPNAQVKDAMDTGAAAYLSKPYRYSDLLKIIREVLDKPGGEPLAAV